MRLAERIGGLVTLPPLYKPISRNGEAITQRHKSPGGLVGSIPPHLVGCCHAMRVPPALRPSETAQGLKTRACVRKAIPISLSGAWLSVPLHGFERVALRGSRAALSLFRMRLNRGGVKPRKTPPIRRLTGLCLAAGYAGSIYHHPQRRQPCRLHVPRLFSDSGSCRMLAIGND